MATAHTPGPWKAIQGLDDDATRCFVVQDIPGRHQYLIAMIENGAPGDSLDTELANARLVAASPKLIDALKRLVDVLNDDLDPDQCAAWDAAVAAIAEVEGR